MKRLAALLQVVYLFLVAGAAYADGDPASISAIFFEGAGALEADLRQASGLEVGQPFSPTVLRSAIKAVYRRGLFGRVQAFTRQLPQGVEIVFRLTPRRLVREVRFFGNDTLVEAGRLSRLRAGDELDWYQLSASAEDILAFYRQRGFRRARVLYRAEDQPDGNLVLSYFIQEGRPTRVSRLWLRGQPLLSEKVISSILGLKVKSRLDQVQLEKGLDSLRKHYRQQGYLEARIKAGDVDPNHAADWEVLVLDIEAGPHYGFDFRGQQRLRRDYLEKTVKKYLDELPSDYLPDASELARRLQENYRRRGYARAVVKAWVETTKTGEKLLVFEIFEGVQFEVADVNFPGAEKFSSSFLRAFVEQALLQELPQTVAGQHVDAGDLDFLGGGSSRRPRLVQRERSFFFDLAPEKVLLESAWRDGLGQIVDFYQSNGFLEIALDEPLVERDDASGRLFVDIPLTEGPQTMVSSMALEGNQVISSLELLQLAEEQAGKLAPGKPLDMSALESWRRGVQNRYAELGYLYCQVRSDLNFSSDRRTVEITLLVEEGPQVRVGHVQVCGYLATDPAVFEHLVDLRRGDVFSPGRALAVRRKLDRLGIFSGAEVKLLDSETIAPEKDVLVEVRERSRRSLVLSPGISSAEGLRLQLEFGHRNLWGKALDLVGRAKISYLAFYPLYPQWEQRYQQMSFFQGLEGYGLAGLHLPRMWWLEQEMAGRLDLVAMQDHAISHDLTKFGLTPGLDWELGEKLLLSGELELEYDRLGCIGVECGGPTQKYLRYDEGSLLLSGLRSRLAWDKRDDIFYPRRGYLLTMSSELAGNLLWERPVFYLKLETLSSMYMPIGRWLTAAFSVQTGFIVNLLDESKTPSHKLFWLGGRNSVRGFAEEALIPADQHNPDNPSTPCVSGSEGQERKCVSLGGNAQLLLKAELRFSLVPDLLQGAVFLDFGNLWMQLDNVRPWLLRPSTGFGLRLLTPVGPVALDLGVNLDPDASRGEESWILHFNIGVF